MQEGYLSGHVSFILGDCRILKFEGWNYALWCLIEELTNTEINKWWTLCAETTLESKEVLLLRAETSRIGDKNIWDILKGY